jgi:hypothetical protein
VTLQVKAIDGDNKEYTITLEEQDLMWQFPEVK